MNANNTLIDLSEEWNTDNRLTDQNIGQNSKDSQAMKPSIFSTMNRDSRPSKKVSNVVTSTRRKLPRRQDSEST